METYSLSPEQCRVLIEEPGGVAFFEQALQNHPPSAIFNWWDSQASSQLSLIFFRSVHSPNCYPCRVTSELLGRIHPKGLTLENSIVTPTQISSIVELLSAGTISGKIGKQILELMAEGDSRLSGEIAQEKGWKVLSDRASLTKMVEELMNKHPDQVLPSPFSFLISILFLTFSTKSLFYLHRCLL